MPVTIIAEAGVNHNGDLKPPSGWLMWLRNAVQIL